MQLANCGRPAIPRPMAQSPRPPLVSCLCITYNRPEFHRFLLRNYQKQTYANRELVVVDGSDIDHSTVLSGEGIRYCHMPSEPNIPRKRNRALELARGDMVTWFDDDDWQHPRKCEKLVAALQAGAGWAGNRASAFYDAPRGMLIRYEGKRPLFNSVGIRAEAAKSVRFDETVLKASDNRWMRLLERSTDAGAARMIEEPLFCWVSHAKNISNPAGRRRASYRGGLLETRAFFGDEWQAFSTHMEAIGHDAG